MDACACMGPLHGDPFCYCEMKQRNLKPSKNYEWTQEQKDNLNKVLSEIFTKRNSEKSSKKLR